MPISKFGQSVANYMENAIQKTFSSETKPKQGTITLFVKIAKLPPLSIQASTSLSIEQLLSQILGSNGQPYRKEIANIKLLSSANNTVKTVSNYQATIADYGLTNESSIQLVLANEGLLGGFEDWENLINTTTVTVVTSAVLGLAGIIWSCCTGKKIKSSSSNNDMPINDVANNAQQQQEQAKIIHCGQATYQLQPNTSITVADLMTHFGINQVATTEGFWSTNQGDAFYKLGVDLFNYNDIQDGLIVEELNVAGVYNIQLASNDDGTAILTTNIVTNIAVQLTTTFVSNAANVGTIANDNILTLTGVGAATITCTVQLLGKTLRNQPAQIVCNIHQAILQFIQGQYRVEYLRLVSGNVDRPLALPNFLVYQITDIGREILILMQANNVIAATFTANLADLTPTQVRQTVIPPPPNGNDDRPHIDLANNNIIFLGSADRHRLELINDYNNVGAAYHNHAQQIINNELGGGGAGANFLANPSKINYQNVLRAFIQNYVGGANNANIGMSYNLRTLNRFYSLRFPANHSTTPKATILFSYNAGTLTVFHAFHGASG